MPSSIVVIAQAQLDPQTHDLVVVDLCLRDRLANLRIPIMRAIL
jgi:hypothetical protein